MNQYQINLVIVAAYILIFGCGEILYRKGVEPYMTRKMVHMGAGILTSLLPFFVNFYFAIIIGLSASILLLITKKGNVLRSVHCGNEKSVGSLFFAPALTLTAIIFWPINVVIFQSSVLVLAIADALAGVFGFKFGKKTYSIMGKKTYLGSFIFFVLTALVYVLTMDYAMALFASFLLTTVEAVFGRGWDNLAIPLASGVILYILL